VPESLGLLVVLWQESIRLELRTAYRALPLPPRATEFYYYQFGDFVNGYLNAFLADGLVEPLRRWRAPATELPVKSLRRQAIVASLFSMLVIIGFETVPTAFNHADVRDIPAGVAGALLYLCIRLAAIA